MGLFDILGAPFKIAGGLIHDITGGSTKSSVNAGPMQDWLNQFLKPQATYMQGIQRPINTAFLDFLKAGPQGAMESALTGAEAWAANASRAGGPLQTSVLNALGGMAGKGFSPGGADRNVNAIMNQFMQDFGNQFTSQAVPLAQSWQNILASGFGTGNEAASQALLNPFTAMGNIQQLNLAGQQQNIANQGLIGQIGGNIFGNLFG